MQSAGLIGQPNNMVGFFRRHILPRMVLLARLLQKINKIVLYAFINIATLAVTVLFSFGNFVDFLIDPLIQNGLRVINGVVAFLEHHLPKRIGRLMAVAVGVTLNLSLLMLLYTPILFIDPLLAGALHSAGLPPLLQRTRVFIRVCTEIVLYSWLYTSFKRLFQSNMAVSLTETRTILEGRSHIVYLLSFPYVLVESVIFAFNYFELFALMYFVDAVNRLTISNEPDNSRAGTGILDKVLRFLSNNPLPKAYINLRNTIINSYRGLWKNRFEQAVDQLIATGDFTSVHNYLGTRVASHQGMGPHLGIRWNRVMLWEMTHNKYTREDYWQTQKLSDAECDMISEKLNIRCSITQGLPIIPIYIVKNGVRQYYDLFSFLQMCKPRVTFQDVHDPNTRERIDSVNEIVYARRMHRRMQNEIKGLRGDYFEELETFEQVLKAAVAASNFKIVGDFLLENGTYLLGNHEQQSSWDWRDIKTQFALYQEQNKLFAHVPDNERAALLEQIRKSNPQFLCSLTYELMICPVYLEINNSRYYIDMFALLSWLERSDRHPVLDQTININDVKIDSEMYRQIEAIRSDPLIVRKTKAQLFYAAVMARSCINLGTSYTAVDQQPDACRPSFW